MRDMVTTSRIGSVALAALLMLGAVCLAACGIATSASAVQQPAASPATAEQKAELTSLLRREERAVFTSLVSGDLHEFPTIFYNDPSVPLSTGFKDAMTRVGPDAIAQAIATAANGPRGSGEGFLSARVALAIERQRQLAAWNEATAKAAAEGRRPSAADLPPGMSPPANPLSASEWVDVPFDIYDVMIQGDHATAALAYGSRDQSEVVDTYTFTRVDGHWYISGVNSAINPNLKNQQPVSSPAVSRND